MKRTFAGLMPLRWIGVALMAGLAVLAVAQREQLADWLRQEPKAALTEELTEQKPLKVLTYAPDYNFYNTYGRIYMARNPDVDVQAVSAFDRFQWNNAAESLRTVMQEEQPDVMVLPPAYYSPDVLAGLTEWLTPLNSWMSRDGWTADRLQPAVKTYLQAGTADQLYGLSPTMNNLAVYYNKDLFDRQGVPYPKDGITWDGLFQLAGRFPASPRKEESQGGLQLSYSGGDLAVLMARSQKLAPPAGDGTNADAWRKLLQTLKDAYAKGVIKERPDMGGGSYMMDDFYKKQGFTNGTAALYIGTYDFSRDLDRYAKTAFHWDVVTLPAEGGETAEVNPGEIFVIPKDAGNKDEAWKLIKGVMSKELTKAMTTSSLNGGKPPLYSQPAFMPERAFNVQAFYKGEAASSRTLLPGEPSAADDAAFRSAVVENVNLMLKGRLEPETALKQIVIAAMPQGKGGGKP